MASAIRTLRGPIRCSPRRTRTRCRPCGGSSTAYASNASASGLCMSGHRTVEDQFTGIGLAELGGAELRRTGQATRRGLGRYAIAGRESDPSRTDRRSIWGAVEACGRAHRRRADPGHRRLLTASRAEVRPRHAHPGAPAVVGPGEVDRRLEVPVEQRRDVSGGGAALGEFGVGGREQVGPGQQAQEGGGDRRAGDLDRGQDRRGVAAEGVPRMGGTAARS